MKLRYFMLGALAITLIATPWRVCQNGSSGKTIADYIVFTPIVAPPKSPHSGGFFTREIAFDVVALWLLCAGSAVAIVAKKSG